jgi:uncharacterized protein YkwD
MKRATLMLALLLALGGTTAAIAGATDATPASTERMSELDGQILKRLNVTRAAHGLRPLVASNELGAAADAHSRELIQAGVFQHESPDGTSFARRVKRFYSATGYARWAAGENLLYSNTALHADAAINAWLDSPPHRRNLLDPSWREVGVGTMRANSAGGVFGGDPTLVITMDFGVRSGARAAAAMAPAK